MDERVKNCQYAVWYPLFKALVPRSLVLNAPEEFRDYLLSDGIALFGDATGEDSSEWESDVPEKEADLAVHEPTRPPQPFHDEIERAIEKLNGEVAPKLNWSAPVDATWILPSNTMRCTCANDVYMLLKSSDYANHDLQLEPPELTLVLREWFDVHPSLEFRCFVREGRLVGISQRDMNYYGFLEKSRALIENVFLDLAAKLSRSFPDPSFVFDAYAAKSFERAWLFDINPWMEKTDSLLFSWEELPLLDTLEVRLIEKDDRSRTFNTKPHSTSQVPYELVDMPRGAVKEMLEMMKEQRLKESQDTDPVDEAAD